MKLSKKGYEKLFEFFMSGKYFDATKCDQIEFEPDDFDGYFQNGKDHVVLTVDEVFTLKQMIQWVMKSSRLSGMNKVFLEKTYNFLNKRFEKTEKSNESQT